MDRQKYDSGLRLQAFAEDLGQVLHARFGNSRNESLTYNVDALSVHAKSDEFVLFLRFFPEGIWPDSTLVITQIVFEQERLGHGTAILHCLVKWAYRYGYTLIGIEQTHDGTGIQNFVRKYGFRDDGRNRNWIAPVTSIAARLSPTFLY